MANAVVTALGRVQPIYKGQYQNNVTYNTLENVIYNGSSYVSIVDNNRNHLPTDTNYWRLVASVGGPGPKGDTGSFGPPTADAYLVPSGSLPEVSVTATGPDDGKIFNFNFGIPLGPYGFDDITGTATTLAAGEPVTVETELDTSGGNRVLKFDFGIPAADGQGVQFVDGVAADSNNNVTLNSVRYSVQNLSNLQKKIACANIDAIMSPSSPTFGGFLRFSGTMSNPVWVTESLEEISTSVIDAIVI